MSDYTQTTDFSAKDALSSGDPEKIILGADVDVEFTAIQTAVATKYDVNDLASQAQAEGEALNTVLMTPLRVANWSDFNAGIVGDLQALTDPGADTLLGWDDSASAAIGFTFGSGLTTSGTTALVDSTIVPLLASSNTYTSSFPNFRLSTINPGFELFDTDAPADEKLYRIIQQDGVFTIQTRTDADGAGVAPLTIRRTGTTVDTLELAATSITLNGVASSDFARLSQSNVFAGSLEISNNAPVFWLDEADATADNGRWKLTGTVEGLFWQTRNDADSAGGTFLEVQRTGTTVDSIALTATSITLNGVASSDFARLSQTNEFTAAVLPIHINNTTPQIDLQESGATSGNQRWQFLVTNEQLRLRVVDDIAGTPANWLTVDRTGSTVDTVALNATTFDFNGNLDLSGTVTSPNTASNEVGFKGIPARADQSGNYTYVLGDAAGHIEYTGTGGHTFTMPANASVAYPSGTVITIVNDGSGSLTLAITTDAQVWGGVGSTGSRTLAANGVATYIKIGSTRWYVTGTGIS